MQITTAMFGAAVLIPAFVILAQLAFLGNAGGAGSGSDTTLSTWLAIATFLGGIAYLVALVTLMWRTQGNCRWCVYYLIIYAVYVAAMLAYISLGDFAHQAKTSGLMTALSNNFLGILYLAVPVVFVVLLAVRSRVRELSSS